MQTLTITQIAALIQRGELVHADMVRQAIIEETAGGDYDYWPDIFDIYSLILALNNALTYQDYASDQTILEYKLLQCFVGARFLDGAQADPYAQENKNVTVVVVGGGNMISSGPVFFNTMAVNIANWQANYVATYGNDPTIEVFDMDGTPQDLTAPKRNYTADDPTQPLLSITWNYPVATQGYYIIKGTKPQ